MRRNVAIKVLSYDLKKEKLIAGGLGLILSLSALLLGMISFNTLKA